MRAPRLGRDAYTVQEWASLFGVTRWAMLRRLRQAGLLPEVLAEYRVKVSVSDFVRVLPEDWESLCYFASIARPGTGKPCPSVADLASQLGVSAYRVRLLLKKAGLLPETQGPRSKVLVPLSSIRELAGDDWSDLVLDILGTNLVRSVK